MIWAEANVSFEKKKKSRPSVRILLPQRAVPSNTASYIMHQKREQLQCSALQGISCLLNSNSGGNNTHRHTLDVRDVREEQAGSTLGRKDNVFMIVTARVVPALFPQHNIKELLQNKEVQGHHLFCSVHVHGEAFFHFPFKNISIWKRYFLESSSAIWGWHETGRSKLLNTITDAHMKSCKRMHFYQSGKAWLLEHK